MPGYGMAFELYEHGEFTGEAAYIVTEFMGRPDRVVIITPEFPLLRKIWGFKSTRLGPRRVPVLRDELERLLPRTKELGSAMAEEIPIVIELLKSAEQRRLSVQVSGP